MANQQAMLAAFATWGAKKFGKGQLTPEQFIQKFQQLGDNEKQQIMKAFQEDPEAQKLVQQAQGAVAARLGTKLQYIKKLKGITETDEIAKESDPIEDFKQAFKCGGKTKKAKLACGGKKKKCENGAAVSMACGGKKKKCERGIKLPGTSC